VPVLEVSEQHGVTEQTAAALQPVVVNAQTVSHLLRTRQRVPLLNSHRYTVLHLLHDKSNNLQQQQLLLLLLGLLQLSSVVAGEAGTCNCPLPKF